MTSLDFNPADRVPTTSADSAPGPDASPHDPTIQGDLAPDPPMRRPRLLLADDHRVVLEGLSQVLGRDYDVVGKATDGTRLLRMALELEPDVIVADLSMPGLSGTAVARALAERKSPCRVVLMTAHEEPELAADALREGVAGYVLKSADTSDLFDAIQAALRGDLWLSPTLAGEVVSVQQRRLRSEQVDGLTERQLEVLRLLAQGLIAKEIASALGISKKTVDYHKYKMMQKLDVRTTAELIHCAAKRDLLRNA